MDLEKQEGAIKWFKKDNLKIRLKKEGESSVVSVMLDGYNICFDLMMYDFIDRIKEALLINIQIKKIWDNRHVIIVDSNDAMILMDYIAEFVDEWNIKISENTVSDADIISSKLWYRQA